MLTTMTPRQVREEIEKIDRQLAQLQPWEETLSAARRRYVLAGDDDARWALSVIDNGPRGEGRPSDPDLAGFNEGLPGLRSTRQLIAELQERRPLLVHQLPSDAETAERTVGAEKLANDIRARAEHLATVTASAHATLNEAARLALVVVEEARQLWEDNAALDKLTAAADVARPETPRADGPKFRIATPLALLLRDHFIDARPGAVDANLRREICDALVCA
jgi:hypothetical protein